MEKAKQEIQSLLSVKLTGAAVPERKMVQAVQKRRLEVAGQLAGLEARKETLTGIVGDLEEKINSAVRADKDASGYIQKLITSKGSIEALDREAGKLTREADQLATKHKAAIDALGKALLTGIEKARQDVEALCRRQLESSIKLMAAFEHEAFELCKAHSYDIPRRYELEIGRFLALGKLIDDLEPFVMPIGKDSSFVGRRDVRRKLLG